MCVYEKNQYLHKCIINNTYFDRYAININQTDFSKLVADLRKEITFFHKNKIENHLDSLLFDLLHDLNMKSYKFKILK